MKGGGGESYFQLQAFFNHGQFNYAANLIDPTSNKKSHTHCEYLN